MKPLPNPRDLGELRGLKCEIATTTPAGLPLKVAFNSVKGGPLDKALVKGPRAADLDPEARGATPWFLRYRRDGKRTWLACGDDLDAALEKAAFTLTQLAKGDGTKFGAYIGAVQSRATQTVGSLADEWIAAGYPKHNGFARPTTENLIPFFMEALKFWRPVAITAVNRPMWDKYVQERRATVAAREAKRTNKLRPMRSGNRAIDLEMETLRGLCKWALATERTTTNPFAALPRARDPKSIINCNSQMPESDEELHQLCGHLLGKGHPTPELVAGAQLLFQALSGLRPGEPGALRWDAKQGHLVHGPGFLHSVPRDGKPQARLAVKRLKRGITPFVKIHPALDQFIAAWRTYHITNFPGSPWWFPAPWAPEHPLCPWDDENNSLCKIMSGAVERLGLPYRRPHAMRAFYVRCRRSAEATDDQIADELGERSGAILIQSTYGDPEGVRGDGLFDWLPSAKSGMKPAWTILSKATETVTPFVAKL